MDTSPKVTEPDAKDTLDPGCRNEPCPVDPEAWLVMEEMEVTEDRPIRCAMAAALSAGGPDPCSAFSSWAVCRRMSWA